MRAIVAGVIVCGLGGTAIAQNRRQPGMEVRTRNIRSIVDPTHVPTSLAQLVALSPVVVIATCEGELPSRFLVKDNPESDVVTERIVRVNEVLKGKLSPKAEIVVRELGGAMPMFDGTRSVKQVISHLKPIESQQRYLLFLRPISEVEDDRFDGRRFWVTGIWAGSFQLVNGRVRLSEGVEPGLRGLDGLTEGEVLARARNAVQAEIR
jgi:hypothetical protein